MRKPLALYIITLGLLVWGVAGGMAATPADEWSPRASTHLLCPAVPSAEPALPADPADEPVFLTQGPCTVARDCYANTCPSYFCPDTEIRCSSGSGGYCSSGPGGSCGGWVECDGARTYCTPQSASLCPQPCGGAPSCSKASDCTAYCGADPPLCTSGHCCIYI